jgi:hypothetical protein
MKRVPSFCSRPGFPAGLRVRARRAAAAAGTRARVPTPGPVAVAPGRARVRSGRLTRTRAAQVLLVRNAKQLGDGDLAASEELLRNANYECARRRCWAPHAPRAHARRAPRAVRRAANSPLRRGAARRAVSCAKDASKAQPVLAHGSFDIVLAEARRRVAARRAPARAVACAARAGRRAAARLPPGAPAGSPQTWQHGPGCSCRRALRTQASDFFAATDSGKALRTAAEERPVVCACPAGCAAAPGTTPAWCLGTPSVAQPLTARRAPRAQC